MNMAAVRYDDEDADSENRFQYTLNQTPQCHINNPSKLLQLHHI